MRQQSGGPIIIEWQHKKGVGLFSFDLVNGVCSALSGAAQLIHLFGISDPTAIRYCAETGPLVRWCGILTGGEVRWGING